MLLLCKLNILSPSGSPENSPAVSNHPTAWSESDITTSKDARHQGNEDGMFSMITIKTFTPLIYSYKLKLLF